MEYKLYIVEAINTMTLYRQHWHTDAYTAQEAVDMIKAKLSDEYQIINVWIEADEVWE